MFWSKSKVADAKADYKAYMKGSDIIKIDTNFINANYDIDKERRRVEEYCGDTYHRSISLVELNNELKRFERENSMPCDAEIYHDHHRGIAVRFIVKESDDMVMNRLLSSEKAQLNKCIEKYTY